MDELTRRERRGGKWKMRRKEEGREGGREGGRDEEWKKKKIKRKGGKTELV